MSTHLLTTVGKRSIGAMSCNPLERLISLTACGQEFCDEQ